jgi:hypothetical protein
LEYWIAYKNGMYIADIDENGNLIHTKKENEALHFNKFNFAMTYFRLGYSILKKILITEV